MSSSSGVARGSLSSSCGNGCRVRPRAGRKVGQVAADVGDHRFVVFGDVVDHPTRQCGDGAAEVFLRDVLSGRLFDDRRPGGEDRALSAHDSEVAHRRHQRAMSGRRAEHGGDGRHLARALRLGEQVGGRATVVSAAGTEAGALEHHHQRNLVAKRQFGDAVTLGVAAGTDAAGQGGEVLGAQHHRRTIDRTGTDDEPVGRDLAADERADFAEGARVEESLDARAGVELALAAVFVEPLGTTHAPRVLTATVEILERLLPIRGFCHASFLPSCGDGRAPRPAGSHTGLLTVKLPAWVTAPASRSTGASPIDSNACGEAVGSLEQQGYDGGWTAETSHDPFLPLLLAAEHTTRLELGTNIAVAFARNPMIVANIGWDLQAYSKGRFILGLGTQIQPHIEKRFSMPWSHPARRMREFVSALHAIWSALERWRQAAFRGRLLHAQDHDADVHPGAARRIRCRRCSSPRSAK